MATAMTFCPKTLEGLEAANSAEAPAEFDFGRASDVLADKGILLLSLIHI